MKKKWKSFKCNKKLCINICVNLNFSIAISPIVIHFKMKMKEQKMKLIINDIKRYENFKKSI